MCFVLCATVFILHFNFILFIMLPLNSSSCITSSSSPLLPFHPCSTPSSSSSSFTTISFTFVFFFLSFFIFLHLFLSSIQLPKNFTKLSFDQQPFSFLSPLFQPITFPSVSKSLDSIPFAYFFHFSYLKRPSSTFFISCFHKRASFIFLLLLLAGDVEMNPGPTSSTFTALNLSHLNIRSASSITPNLDKPALLHKFLIDHSIDVLTLSETWLSVDTLPSTLQSLTRQGYSIFHSPRTFGHGGGLAQFIDPFLNFLKLLFQLIPLLNLPAPDFLFKQIHLFLLFFLL